jgi:uncharacterized protein YcbK (DUF882 family)
MNYKYFSERELRCKCGCGRADMDPDFMGDFLIPLRERYGGPVILSSAFRCPEYNAKVSFTGYDGPHTTGKAVDIKVTSGWHRNAIIRLAMELGCRRIGVAGGFVHVDLCEDPRFPKDVIWVYSG